MHSDQDKQGAARGPKGHAPAPGAPTAPAEGHQEPPPATLECAQCRALIPVDQAVVPESLDYVVYFCSPGCHKTWEQARTDVRESGRAHAGRSRRQE